MIELAAPVRGLVARPGDGCRPTKEVLVDIRELQNPSFFCDIAWLSGGLNLLSYIWCERGACYCGDAGVIVRDCTGFAVDLLATRGVLVFCECVCFSNSAT